MAYPSALEQYMLELVNRARQDPLAEVARNDHVATLNEDLAPGTLTAEARQPLAFVSVLEAAASLHSQSMLDEDYFSHTGSDGSSPTQRIFAAGWTDTGSGWSTGENIAWAGTIGTGYADRPATVARQHDALFDSAGHRENLLEGRFSEIGIGHLAGAFTWDGTTYTSTSMVTQKFTDAGRTFLTGVAIDDLNANDFYDVGEGLGGVTVRATGGGHTYTTTTWASGGYTLALPDGSYTVTFSGGALAGPVTRLATIAGANVKLDVQVDEVEGDLVLVGTGAADTLVGAAGADRLFGAAGADTLLGYGGQDLLDGGAGDDLLDGGAGSDFLIFGGARSGFSVRSFQQDGQWYLEARDLSGAEGLDYAVSIEGAQFAGANFGLAGIQQNAVSNVDGGAVNDVLFLNETSGQIGYVDMSAAGAGGFVTLVGAMPAGWRVGATGDLSGDGRAEAVVQDPTSGSIYTVQQGRGWAEVVTSLSADWALQAVGDFTGDGILDPMIRNDGGQLLYLDLDAGGGASGYGTLPNVGTAWRTVGVGDLDRDGISDVVIQNTADGTTWYADIDGGTLAGWGTVAASPGSSWQAAAVADVNGDGYDDVIFRHQATGQIWGVDMLGGSNAGWFIVHNAPSAAWQVAGAFDHDNDGFEDVLVRQADGTTYALDLDAGAFAGWDPITGIMGGDWVLV